MWLAVKVSFEIHLKKNPRNYVSKNSFWNVYTMELLHWYCFISILAWMQFWINFKVDPKHSNKGTLTLLHISTGFHSVVVSMSDWQVRGSQFKSRWGHFIFFFFLTYAAELPNQPNIQILLAGKSVRLYHPI